MQAWTLKHTAPPPTAHRRHALGSQRDSLEYPSISVTTTLTNSPGPGAPLARRLFSSRRRTYLGLKRICCHALLLRMSKRSSSTRPNSSDSADTRATAQRGMEARVASTHTRRSSPRDSSYRDSMRWPCAHRRVGCTKLHQSAPVHVVVRAHAAGEHDAPACNCKTNEAAAPARAHLHACALRIRIVHRVHQPVHTRLRVSRLRKGAQPREVAAAWPRIGHAVAAPHNEWAAAGRQARRQAARRHACCGAICGRLHKAHSIGWCAHAKSSSIPLQCRCLCRRNAP